MFIQGHGCKYTMMTFIYACTTVNMDERTQHEMTMKWHKMNTEQPTWCDTRFELYLMTITCNLIYWITWCKIWMLWCWIRIILLCRWPRPQESYGPFKRFNGNMIYTSKCFEHTRVQLMNKRILQLMDPYIWQALLGITLMHGDVIEFRHNGYHGHIYPLSRGDITRITRARLFEQDYSRLHGH